MTSPMFPSVFQHQHMRGLFTGNGVDGSEPKRMEIEAGKEMLSISQEHRRQGQMHLIDQAGGQIGTNGGNTSANSNVFVSGRGFRFLEGGLDAFGDKEKGRTAFHRQGRARVMREHVYRRVVRRI